MLNQPEFAGTLPEAVDVVIIGGGIIGVMAAWELRKAGRSVLLCEKGRIAGEQSSRNWGWIRQQGREYAELPIMMDTIHLWKAMDPKILSAIGFRQAGINYLAGNEKKLAEFETWLQGARAYGVDTRMLSRRETETMLPNSAGWVGAMQTPSDAMAEPFVTVPVLARCAAEAGVIIRESCAVRSLDLTAGQIAGVVTEAGTVKCEQVVLAAGMWSSLMLAAHGIRIPQLGVVSPVIQTAPMPEFFNAAAADNRFAIRRRADGGYTLTPWSSHDFFIGPDAFRNFITYLPHLRDEFTSTHFSFLAPKDYPDAWGTRRKWRCDEETPFERCRVLDPKPNAGDLERIRGYFAKAFPKLGKPQVQASWAGMIDTLPDMLPIVDRAPIDGLVIATGMSGHGFGIGPGFGQVIADMVQGRPARYDLKPFALGR